METQHYTLDEIKSLLTHLGFTFSEPDAGGTVTMRHKEWAAKEMYMYLWAKTRYEPADVISEFIGEAVQYGSNLYR